MLVLLFISIPSADVFTFGIHEHTAVVDREGDTNDVAQPDHAGHLVSHHCDLSMTPGEVAPHFDLATPAPTAVAMAELPPPHIRSVRFVPFPPPRS